MATDSGEDVLCDQMRLVMSTHDAFIWAFLADDFIGEKWHADAAFTWLGNAAFGA